MSDETETDENASQHKLKIFIPFVSMVLMKITKVTTAPGLFKARNSAPYGLLLLLLTKIYVASSNRKRQNGNLRSLRGCSTPPPPLASALTLVSKF